VFGIGGGGRTPWLFLVACLAFGLIAARVFSLVASPGWWEEKQIDQEDALRDIEGMEDLKAEMPVESNPRPDAPDERQAAGARRSTDG
jgi:hypothetical protein